MALNINGTTGISGVEGSVSAPVLTGTDSNCGISFPAADTIKFSTGGVERMAITNSGVSGITAGITMADAWRLSSSYTGGNGFLTANWEQVDTYNYARIGSSMSQSSGVFSFPVTGVYLVHYFVNFKCGTDQSYLSAFLYTTTDNSNYYMFFSTDEQINDVSGGGQQYATAHGQAILDITDVSTHKIKFAVDGYNNPNYTIEGNSTFTRTGVNFVRLGDT